MHKQQIAGAAWGRACCVFVDCYVEAFGCGVCCYCEWEEDGEEEDVESQHEFTFKSYASNYWSGHVRAAGEDNANIVSLTEQFLSLDNQNFQHWRKYVQSSNHAEAETEADEVGVQTQLSKAESSHILFTLL